MAFLGRKKDVSKIAATLKEEGDQLITLSDIKVVIPYSFLSKGLLFLDGGIQSVGYFAIMTNTEYAYYNIPAMVSLGSGEINETVIEESPYYEISYQKGDVLIKDLNLVQKDSLLYTINELIVAMGNVPHYMSYDDLDIFANSRYYTGVTVGSTANTMDVFYSIIGRDPDDMSKQYRSGPQTKPCEFIAFRNIALTANSTMARIIGSHSDQGIDSALVNKTERLNRPEQISRL